MSSHRPSAITSTALEFLRPFIVPNDRTKQDADSPSSQDGRRSPAHHSSKLSLLFIFQALKALQSVWCGGKRPRLRSTATKNWLGCYDLTTHLFHHRQDWAGCRSETIAPAPSSAETSVTVTDLNPSSSYLFRLYIVAADGQEVGPGPEIAFDTEGIEEYQLCPVCMVRVPL